MREPLRVTSRHGWRFVLCSYAPAAPPRAQRSPVARILLPQLPGPVRKQSVAAETAEKRRGAVSLSLRLQTELENAGLIPWSDRSESRGCDPGLLPEGHGPVVLATLSCCAWQSEALFTRRPGRSPRARCGDRASTALLPRQRSEPEDGGNRGWCLCLRARARVRVRAHVNVCVCARACVHVCA